MTEINSTTEFCTFCRRVSCFPVEKTFSHITEKLRKRNLLCFRNILESQKIMEKRGSEGLSRFSVQKILFRPKTVSRHSKTLFTVCRADISRHISKMQKTYSIHFHTKNKTRNTENWKIFAKKNYVTTRNWFRQIEFFINLKYQLVPVSEISQFFFFTHNMEGKSSTQHCAFFFTFTCKVSKQDVQIGRFRI